MLSGVGTDSVPELEQMLSGVGTYLFRSLAVSRGVCLEYHCEHSK